MSLETLIANIKQNIHEKKNSINDFEKNAEFKKSILNNIISGKSKNPTIKTVALIAKQFDCQIDSLVSSKADKTNNKYTQKQSYRNPETEDEIDIFFNTILSTVDIFQKNKMKPNIKDFFSCAEKIFSTTLMHAKGKSLKGSIAD